MCDAAAEHFAVRGYDAASLNDIAAAVGIRKASLYAHFTGKDALFLAVLDDALAIESEFAARCFAAEAAEAAGAAAAVTAADAAGTNAAHATSAAGPLPGWRYCEQLAGRYRDSPHLRFLLRTAYLPPHALWEQIGQRYEPLYLDPLLAAFQARLRAAGHDADDDLATFGHAYLGIIDSLHVLLIYTGGERLSPRLAAFHRLLADALRRPRS